MVATSKSHEKYMYLKLVALIGTHCRADTGTDWYNNNNEEVTASSPECVRKNPHTHMFVCVYVCKYI